MNDTENYIVKHINDKRFKFPKEFNPSVEYSDEFYETIIKVFHLSKRKRYFYRFIKRIFDFFVSLICIILLIPVFIIVALAIKIDSKGPVIFKQDRMGKNFKPFKCFKFRSMAVEAPKNLSTEEMEKGKCYVTKVGRFIRKTSIDELAQLFNIFTGKMSIISYRPIILTEDKLNNYRNELGVFSIKPGITGFAQVHGRDNVTYRNKALMDAYYVKHASFLLDTKLIFGSAFVILSRKNNRDNKAVDKTLIGEQSFSNGK